MEPVARTTKDGERMAELMCRGLLSHRAKGNLPTNLSSLKLRFEIDLANCPNCGDWLRP